MVKKYKDSFQTQSESLAQGGRGIITAVENEDIHTKFEKAPPPEFDAPKHQGNISSIRTLASDMQSAVETSNVSLASEALKKAPAKQVSGKEKRTVPQKETYTKQPRKRSVNPYLIVISLVLVVFGVSLYLFSTRQGVPLGSLSFSAPKLPSFSSGNQDQSVPDTREVFMDTLVRTDNHKTFLVNTSSDREMLARELKEVPLETSGATTILLQTISTTTNGDDVVSETIKLPATELFSLLRSSASSILPRSITDYSMGTVSSGGQGETFLVAKVRNFDDTFGAMLDWEKNMAIDLHDIFHNDSRSLFNNEAFRDVTVSSTDARELTVTNEESTVPVLIYAFPNKSTLIITHSSAALEDILNRLIVTE